MRKMPFDPMALAHITRLVRMPFIVAVRNDLPAKTLPEFMDLARRTEIRWASGGIGTSQHLAGELFTQMSGLKMVHVPYRGTGPALNDLAAGIVDAYFGDPATLGVIKGGKARAMAVTSPERWPVLPDTPALAEAVPGYEAWNWYGIDAPPEHARASRRSPDGRHPEGDGRSRGEDEVRRQRPASRHPVARRLPRLHQARFGRCGRGRSPRATSRSTRTDVLPAWPSISAARSPTSCWKPPTRPHAAEGPDDDRRARTRRAGGRAHHPGRGQVPRRPTSAWSCTARRSPPTR